MLAIPTVLEGKGDRKTDFRERSLKGPSAG